MTESKTESLVNKIYKPSRAQKEFMESNVRMVLVTSSPNRNHYDWVRKKFLEKIKDEDIP